MRKVVDVKIGKTLYSVKTKAILLDIQIDSFKPFMPLVLDKSFASYLSF